MWFQLYFHSLAYLHEYGFIAYNQIEIYNIFIVIIDSVLKEYFGKYVISSR